MREGKDKMPRQTITEKAGFQNVVSSPKLKRVADGLLNAEADAGPINRNLLRELEEPQLIGMDEQNRGDSDMDEADVEAVALEAREPPAAQEPREEPPAAQEQPKTWALASEAAWPATAAPREDAPLISVASSRRKPRPSDVKLVEKELEDNYRECPKSEWHLRQWNRQTLFNYVLEHWTRGQDADRRSSYELPQTFWITTKVLFAEYITPDLQLINPNLEVRESLDKAVRSLLCKTKTVVPLERLLAAAQDTDTADAFNEREVYFVLESLTHVQPHRALQLTFAIYVLKYARRHWFYLFYDKVLSLAPWAEQVLCMWWRTMKRDGYSARAFISAADDIDCFFDKPSLMRAIEIAEAHRDGEKMGDLEAQHIKSVVAFPLGKDLFGALHKCLQLQGAEKVVDSSIERYVGADLKCESRTECLRLLQQHFGRSAFMQEVPEKLNALWNMVQPSLGKKRSAACKTCLLTNGWGSRDGAVQVVAAYQSCRGRTHGGI